MATYEEVHHMRLRFMTFELDVYFTPQQEQCLKNCTLALNFLSDVWGRLVFIHGAFKDKFSFSTQSQCLLESQRF